MLTPLQLETDTLVVKGRADIVFLLVHSLPSRLLTHFRQVA